MCICVACVFVHVYMCVCACAYLCMYACVRACVGGTGSQSSSAAALHLDHTWTQLLPSTSKPSTRTPTAKRYRVLSQ